MKPIRMLFLFAAALFATESARAGCTSGKSADLDPEAIVYSATAYWDDEMDEWFVAGPYWDFAGDRAKNGCDDEATELEQIVVTAQAMSAPTRPSGVRRMISSTVGIGRKVTEETIRQCQMANAALESNECDGHLTSLEPDGCGSGLSELIVPDGYMGLNATSGIFTTACNTHDRCYSLPGAYKLSCDVELGNNMRETCNEFFDPTSPIFASTDPNELAEHRSLCNLQAQVYETGLMHAVPFLSALSLDMLPSSQSAFDAAQKAAKCNPLIEQQRVACNVR